jgi:hypothetical protein
MTTLTINGIDKSSLISWQSLSIDEILTKSANTCRFYIKKYESKTYKPIIGEEVVLTVDGTIEFAGYIIEINEKISGMLEVFDIVCKDYTHGLDKYLVSKTYLSETVNDIIADILTTFTDGTFTDTHVNCDTLIESINFNYLPVSKALEKIISIVGNFDWYVDYEKDIHFFNNTTESSAFDITDTSGNYVFNSLIYKEDITQLKNDVIIRGGLLTSETPRTEYLDGDGTKTIFALATKFAKLPTVTVNAVSKTVGVDFLDDPSSFDLLWNYNEKSLKFTSAPASGTANIVVVEYPKYPLIVQKSDESSISTYGVAQSIIVDKTITDLDTANLRATVELLQYSQPLKTATFSTYTKGLITGQTINIQSNIRNIDVYLKIQNIRKSFSTPTGSTMLFNISCVNNEDLGINDIWTRLLVKNQSDQIDISEDEYISRIRGMSDSLTITDSIPTATKTSAPYVYDTALYGFSTYS